MRTFFKLLKKSGKNLLSVLLGAIVLTAAGLTLVVCSEAEDIKPVESQAFDVENGNSILTVTLTGATFVEAPKLTDFTISSLGSVPADYDGEGFTNFFNEKATITRSDDYHTVTISNIGPAYVRKWTSEGIVYGKISGQKLTVSGAALAKKPSKITVKASTPAPAPVAAISKTFTPEIGHNTLVIRLSGGTFKRPANAKHFTFSGPAGYTTIKTIEVSESWEGQGYDTVTITLEPVKAQGHAQEITVAKDAQAQETLASIYSIRSSYEE